MYQSKQAVPNARSLDQGDLLRGVVVPAHPTEKSFMRREGPKVVEAKPVDVKTADSTLRIQVGVKKWEWAIVLTASCDIAQGHLIELAPVQPWEPKGQSDAERWSQISALATGAGAPRQFYMPANPTIGLPRSRAQLDGRLFVDPTFIDRCIGEYGTTRVAGLALPATRHLQWALSFLYGRNAREDHEWPSRDDLVLKRAWLETAIKSGGPLKDSYEADLRLLEAMLGEVDKAAAS